MARDHDCVHVRGQPVAFEIEGLAQQPLDAISLDGATDLPRHRQAEPGTGDLRTLAPREHVEHELTSGVGTAVPEHPIEVGAT
jgi:hypothetical protein